MFSYNDSTIILVGFLVLIFGAIVMGILYQKMDDVRDSVVFNNFGAIIVGVCFIILVFNFMDQRIIIFGSKIDAGLLVYISIAIFVVFILGG